MANNRNNQKPPETDNQTDNKLGNGPVDNVDLSAQTPPSGQKTPDKNTARDKELAELTENVGYLVKIVKDSQESNEQLRSTIATMQQKHEEEMAKVTEIIESVGDKSRVASWQTKNAKQLPREYSICTFNGKVVTGWDKMKTNLVYKNELKATVERLVSTLHFADGTKEDVEYTVWQNARVMLPAQYNGKEAVIDKETGEEHQIIKLKVLQSEITRRLNIVPGTEYAIDVIFLN